MALTVEMNLGRVSKGTTTGEMKKGKDLASDPRPWMGRVSAMCSSPHFLCVGHGWTTFPILPCGRYSTMDRGQAGGPGYNYMS